MFRCSDSIKIVPKSCASSIQVRYWEILSKSPFVFIYLFPFTTPEIPRTSHSTCRVTDLGSALGNAPIYVCTCAGVAKEIALRLPEKLVSVSFIIIGCTQPLLSVSHSQYDFLLCNFFAIRETKRISFRGKRYSPYGLPYRIVGRSAIFGCAYALPCYLRFRSGLRISQSVCKRYPCTYLF